MSRKRRLTRRHYDTKRIGKLPLPVLVPGTPHYREMQQVMGKCRKITEIKRPETAEKIEPHTPHKHGIPFRDYEFEPSGIIPHRYSIPVTGEYRNHVFHVPDKIKFESAKVDEYILEQIDLAKKEIGNCCELYDKKIKRDGVDILVELIFKIKM